MELNTQSIRVVNEGLVLHDEEGNKIIFTPSQNADGTYSLVGVKDATNK